MTTTTMLAGAVSFMEALFCDSYTILHGPPWSAGAVYDCGSGYRAAKNFTPGARECLTFARSAEVLDYSVPPIFCISPCWYTSWTWLI